MQQSIIFDDPPHNGTATSEDSARSMRGCASYLRRKIVNYISAQPNGATCDEVESALAMTHQTASARITELFQSGHLKSDCTRKTRSGRMARVYVVKRSNL